MPVRIALLEMLITHRQITTAFENIIYLSVEKGLHSRQMPF